MIKFPITAITNGAKTSWLLKAQELLRQEHNIMGDWFREGIKETSYQQLKAEVQISFPYYVGKLSEIDWEKYQNDRWIKKQNIIGQGITQYRSACFTSNTYSPNLDDDIII